MAKLYHPPTQNGLQKTLGAQLDEGHTTAMTLNNVTGVQNKPGIVVINRVAPDGTENDSSVREFIAYTGTSGSTLTGLTRAMGGSTDQDHAVGSVVEFVPDVNVFQSFVDFIEQHGDSDNTGSGVLYTDTLSEKTDGAGVTIDSLLIKDGRVAHWDGWSPAEETWTYASATSFTISGVDRTSRYTKGTKIKLTQTSAKYFVVASSSFSTNTTVNLIPTSDYSVANAAITNPYYSYAANPQGFPTWFVYVPTVTPAGSMTWASDDSTGLWSVQGSCITFWFQARGTTGGSASNGLGVSLPVAKLPAVRMVASGFAFTSDGSFVSAFGYTSASASQSSIECRKYDSSNYALAAGTGVRMSFTYEF